ncbi:hypothetical protein [Vibrio harveyi]|uniref:hypothetical protein n=1 Tax=Vibrio harveyi TaxID=669 RepID=UPI0006800DCD|nr:hypothetical protein [Vibrio harveyi]EJQ9992377.1 hypothetical protein [Vibrio vulnificus]PNM43073.1 hypothetical protein AL469_024535 [Vibrio harveyi]PNM43079.1 hypothetical protein AL469_024575 [Vibrio harveyi]
MLIFLNKIQNTWFWIVLTSLFGVFAFYVENAPSTDTMAENVKAVLEQKYKEIDVSPYEFKLCTSGGPNLINCQLHLNGVPKVEKYTYKSKDGNAVITPENESAKTRGLILL